MKNINLCIFEGSASELDPILPFDRGGRVRVERDPFPFTEFRLCFVGSKSELDCAIWWYHKAQGGYFVFPNLVRLGEGLWKNVNPCIFEGSASELNPIVPLDRGGRVRVVLEGGAVQEAPLRAVLLPRDHTGEAEVRATRIQYQGIAALLAHETVEHALLYCELSPSVCQHRESFFESVRQFIIFDKLPTLLQLLSPPPLHTHRRQREFFQKVAPFASRRLPHEICHDRRVSAPGNEI